MLVEVEFVGEVFLRGGFAEDFDNPIGGADAAPFVELGGVADDADVGLYDGINFIVGVAAGWQGQADVERGAE
jgi:hypothetical protein